MHFFRQLVFAIFGLLSVEAIAQPANDICSSAINIQSSLIQSASALAVAGPFSNVAATGNDVYIDAVTGCWLDDLTGLADGSSPQVDATVWFHFTGIAGVFNIQVQPCDTNLNFISQDTQMVLFTGECDSLVLVDCNEDIDTATYNYWSGIQTELTQDASYYLAVDGFNYSGFGSPELPLTTGEFCLHVTNPTLRIPEFSDAQVTVYPNPNDGQVTITSEEELSEVSLFDCRGSLIQTWTPRHNKRMQIDLPNAAGVYVVRVASNRGVRTMRLMRR
jgi:hypothetical protein